MKEEAIRYHINQLRNKENSLKNLHQNAPNNQREDIQSSIDILLYTIKAIQEK